MSRRPSRGGRGVGAAAGPVLAALLLLPAGACDSSPTGNEVVEDTSGVGEDPVKLREPGSSWPGLAGDGSGGEVGGGS